MRRARADDSFTWEPFDHGRQRRMAALVAVGLCAGLVGIVVGRISSAGSVEIARAPPPESAVTTKNQTAVATPPHLPCITNPATGQQTSRDSNKVIPSRTSAPMSLPVHPKRQTLPAPVPAVGKHNDQALPPASPPVVLLNPGSGQQTADVREKPVPEQAREHRQHSLALVPTSEKRDEQVPARASRAAGCAKVSSLACSRGRQAAMAAATERCQPIAFDRSEPIAQNASLKV